MQGDPERRFAGCGDFRDAILDYQRRERWRRTWLPAIAATCALVAGVGIALWLWKVSQDRRAILVGSQTLQGAGHSLNEFCRESHDRAIKQAGIGLARQMHDEYLVLQFTQRIQEMDANITEFGQQYLNYLQQLRRVPARIAAPATVQALQSVADARARWGTQHVVADLEAARAGHALPSRDELIERCPSAAAGARTK
jgi:hypothetical protein